MTTARNGNGKFRATPETAERDAQVCRLKASGHSHTQIAAMGIPGIKTPGAVSKAVKRAVEAIRSKAGSEYLAESLARLELAQTAAWELVQDPGYRMAPSGAITSTPDNTVKTAALAEYRRCETERVRWLGLASAPTRVNVSVDLDSKLAENNKLILTELERLNKENAQLRAQLHGLPEASDNHGNPP